MTEIDPEIVEKACVAYGMAEIRDDLFTGHEWMTAALHAIGLPELLRKANAYDELLDGTSTIIETEWLRRMEDFIRPSALSYMRACYSIDKRGHPPSE